MILMAGSLLFSSCGNVNVASTAEDKNQSIHNGNDSNEEEWDTTTDRERFQTANVAAASLETDSEEREGVDGETFNFSNRTITEPLYAKCAGCHGANGEKVALGKSDIIGGEAAINTSYQLKEYRAGRLDQYGMGSLMRGQVAQLSDEEITILGIYIQNLSGLE